MNLHKVVASMIAAQNNYDSQAYAACFTENAIVHDEGKTHQGRDEIRQWIMHSNDTYQATLQPLTYTETASGHLLTAEVAGTFPGSPAVLQFHLELQGDLIRSLKITG